jgi:putative acetyltransferase
MDIAIEQAPAPTPEVVELLAELDAALAGPYAADQAHALSVEQLFQPDVRFFVARLEGVAVACGGIGFYDGYAELKRMYSRPSVRGRGVAKAILRHLEASARAAGVPVVRIETGVFQEEALRFYEGAGYRRCDAFGPYAKLPARAIETSIFYEKPV